MKRFLTITAVALALGAAGTACADEALAKANGCLNCHAVATKKMGPALKDIAAKYKGNANAEAELTAKLAEGKKHPAVKAKPEDTKTLVKWVLGQ